MIFKKYFFTLLLVLCFAQAWACSCHTDIEEMNMARFNEADAIFVGEVDSISPCKDSRNVRFIIHEKYKGTLPSVVSIEGIDCKSTCALSFEKKQAYLIYLYRDPENKLRIYPCTGSRKMLSKQETDEEIQQAEKFNTLYYLRTELEIWKHEIDFLEKASLLKDGKVKTYYSNGQITGDGKLENGLPTGEWKYYYPDGNIKASGYYLHGKKTGTWLEHSTYYAAYEDTIGTDRKRYLLKNSGTYEQGFKEGKWQRVNLDGSVQILYYKKGKFISDKPSK